MKTMFVRWFAVLLVSFSFGGSAQAYSLAMSAGWAAPGGIAGVPGATPGWWAAVQAQLRQELGGAPDLSTTADWNKTGETLGDGFSISVASAGDVNGDGYADLVVGAPGYGFTGKAYVYHGSASGLSLTANWSTIGEGVSFGGSVASAGDVNGDGYADLVVGDGGYSSGTGKAYVYHGSASGLNATADWSAVGESTSNRFGDSVASAGDVNGDGYADLAVGANGYPVYPSGEGKAYIYHGSASGLSAAADWSAVGESTSDRFGASVASAGDVNADGYADLAVGAWNYDSGKGKAYVYHGSTGGLSLTADWSAAGEATFIYSGESVASAGDVNGDGYADLAVGAYAYNDGVGKAYVYHGSAGGLGLTADWTAVGEALGYSFGDSVASAGDVNGDGYADLAVGAPQYNTGTGKAYVYYGSAGGLIAAAVWSGVGESTGNYFGSSVASAGDVNGDGSAELAVGAPGYSSSRGKAYVYHGSIGGCVTSCLRVAAIQMQVVSGVVKATVTVRDENGAGVPRAMVSAQWYRPTGVTLEQAKKTGASGLATFKLSGGPGTYTITITDIVLADYTFDPDNSAILSNSIDK